MSDLGLWFTLVLAILGFCCISNFVLLNILHPVKDREIELLLSGNNAECLLRNALRAERDFYVKIMAICEDEEAEKICEILGRFHPNIMFRRLSAET